MLRTGEPMIHLPEIPFVDIRDGGPLLHAEMYREDAIALRNACLSSFPGMRLGARTADALAKRWLERSQSPYTDEIERIARTIAVPGVYAINTSYEWGCTTRAALFDGRPAVRRILDWHFDGLGRHVHLTHQAGPAGRFYSVTWPGAVGVLTAMAPGRFAAAINQAPLRRAGPAEHRAAVIAEIGRQAFRTWTHVRHMPPAHLLRNVFETAADFEQALDMLVSTPVARPALVTLCGTEVGEMCVVERTETGANVVRGPVTVANDWQESRPDWLPGAPAR